MAMTLRLRPAPQCLSCLRRYAIWGLEDGMAPVSSLRQQVRGKRRLPNNSDIVTVRLRKKVDTFGREGAIVPVPRGQMRNIWFPSGIAEYVTAPELKALRLKNVTMERDFQFGVRLKKPEPILPKAIPNVVKQLDAVEPKPANVFREKAEIEKLSPQRSIELIELFVGPRLEFHRQPILEEKEKEPDLPAPEHKKTSTYGSDAAADLLAARTGRPDEVARDTLAANSQAQAIYGSVSPLDVLQAVRAALAENDEAQRVVLSEQDVHFVDLPDTEGEKAKVVKHIGDFVVEIKPKGAEVGVRRAVRVAPLEL